MKIAIVGGGICGLYLGWKLKEKNNEVVIFEAKDRIGDNVVCSGLFSSRILSFLPQSEKLVKNKINYVLIHFPQKTIKVIFSKPFLVMNHSELDQLAGDIARNSGVEINLNRNIKIMPDGFDRIIGCDGFNSFVRRNMGLKEPEYRLGIQGFADNKSSSDFVEVWPLKEGDGFIWKIPRGEEMEYGIMGSPESASERFKIFLAENNIKIGNLKSKVIPQGFILPSHDSITLCGDAMGLTKPWSGGGVIWGLTASKILVDNIDNLSEYNRKTKRFFSFKIFRSKIMVKLVYFFGFKMPWIMPKKAKIESDFLL
jgi:digeranylgeranylglycerophospholipid reductase